MLKDIENEILEDEVINVEEVEFEGYVYDACCEDPHLYLTNDFVSHNCILWIDEIEKALSGQQSSGSTDGGTTSRVLSTFLTWMQEKESPVFVVATANQHETIPSEWLRKGRFDEIFFVDLPDKEERHEVFEVLFKKKKSLNPDDFIIGKLVNVSDTYSGAEMEKAIDNAMLAGFLDEKRKINTDDVMKALGEFKPLFEMRKEDFIDIREWANERCVKANEPRKIKKELIPSDGGNLDI